MEKKTVNGKETYYKIHGRSKNVVHLWFTDVHGRKPYWKRKTLKIEQPAYALVKVINMNNINDMTCIICGQAAKRTAIREDIEAAFCGQHYPAERKRIEIIITLRC